MLEANDPGCVKVNLTGYNLKPKGAQLLAGSLQNNTMVTQLILSNNALEDRGMKIH
jgi:hypothetical protein